MHASLAVSALGATICFVAHINSFLGESISFAVIFGLAVPLIPLGIINGYVSITVMDQAGPLGKDMTRGVANYTAFFRRVPKWMRWTSYSLFAWFAANFCFLMYKTQGAPLKLSWHHKLPLFVEAPFTACWATMYFVLLQIFYTAIHLEGYCLNGHHAVPGSVHCGECLAPVIDWSESKKKQKPDP